MEEVTPNDMLCQMIHEVEGIVPEKTAVEGKIMGLSMYDFFHMISGCETMEECHIKANLRGIELKGEIVKVAEGFIKETKDVKEYQLAIMKIKCGQFNPRNKILPILS